MASLSHGTRHLRQGIGIGRRPTARSVHIPTSIPRPVPPPSTAHRFVSASRSFFSRLLTYLATPSSFAVPHQPSPVRSAHFSNAQSIHARFSLPVRHALSRPFAPPCLPKPPVVPSNVTHVGLGTARAFHSGRPIFQNIVDNVPIAVRALWEAEWDVKMKKKEARKMRRTTRSKSIPQTREMLRPGPRSINEPSELDVYFPVEPAPAITTHVLVPLAPTPTARLPLYTHSDDSGSHPLLPISDLASIHTNHRLHSLRVSTLFAKLDAANVWDDPGVNVDAYAFAPCHNVQDSERQCTILRVTFRGWNAHRVRTILSDSTEEWYSIEETHLDGRPALVSLPDNGHMSVRSQLLSLDSSSACETEVDDERNMLSSLPIQASASAEHDLVLPTLDFSSAFANAADNVPSPPQPIILLHTVSELTQNVESSFASTTPSLTSCDAPTDDWECLTLSSFLQHADEHRQDEWQ